MQLTFRNLPGFRLKAGMTVQIWQSLFQTC